MTTSSVPIHHLGNMLFRVVFSLLSLLLYAEYASGIHIVSREEWGARPPAARLRIPGQLPFIIIHHSEIPDACYTPEDCRSKMREMQDFHQLTKKWQDIGYSFAIGGDGNIYEGRGFNIVGAHAPRYNDKSVGICLIGNWQNELPPQIMLERTHQLINYSVSQGHIRGDYIMYGHRQVRDTDCPGDALFGEIQKWSHFSQNVTLGY